MDTNLPSAVIMAQPQAGDIVELAKQATNIIAAVTEATTVIAVAIRNASAATAPAILHAGTSWSGDEVWTWKHPYTFLS